MKLSLKVNVFISHWSGLQWYNLRIILQYVLFWFFAQI